VLTDEQLKALYDRLGLPLVARNRVDEIRSSQPVRRVKGGGGNFCIRFPSRKMRRIIQAESRTIELPFLIYCEFDPSVYEVWDQPTYLRRSYETLGGRRISGSHIPDYLVIRDCDIEFVECKPLVKLEGYRAKFLDLYARDDNGLWTSPSGLRAAAEIGLGYRVWTTNLVTVTFIRNVDFLSDYLNADKDEP